MSGLWTYGRRPCCVVRYRHGGYNAIYPLAAGETFDGVAETQRQERKAAEGRPEQPQQGWRLGKKTVEAPKSGDNVLSFPGTSPRRKPRDSGRAGPRQSTPPLPKSRD